MSFDAEELRVGILEIFADSQVRVVRRRYRGNVEQGYGDDDEMPRTGPVGLIVVATPCSVYVCPFCKSHSEEHACPVAAKPVFFSDPPSRVLESAVEWKPPPPPDPRFICPVCRSRSSFHRCPAASMTG